MKKLILAAAAVMVMAGSASAADMAVKYRAPPPAPVYNWTGCYVAGGFGYGVSDIDHYISSPGPAFGPAQSTDNGGRGGLFTVGVGCDVQFAGPFGGNWLFGVFADYDWTNIKGNYTTNCPGGCAGPFSYTGEVKDRNAGYVGARLGWLVNPQLLTYVSGGWAATRFDGATLTDTFGGATTVALPSQTYNGWFIGGGTEYAIGWAPGLYWRSEYRFADFRSKALTVACVSGGCNTIPGVNAIDNAHPYVQTVRSELVWRFNWASPVVARY
jgi:outer membrane immunogenic protein